MKDFAADYLVRPSAGGWKLRLEYRERSFEAMEVAFEAAGEAARAAGKSGRTARVSPSSKRHLSTFSFSRGHSSVPRAAAQPRSMKLNGSPPSIKSFSTGSGVQVRCFRASGWARNHRRHRLSR